MFIVNSQKYCKYENVIQCMSYVIKTIPYYDRALQVLWEYKIVSVLFK